jgi:hypothetical protein
MCNASGTRLLAEYRSTIGKVITETTHIINAAKALCCAVAVLTRL